MIEGEAAEVYLAQRSTGVWAVTGALMADTTAFTSRDLGRAVQMCEGLLVVGAGMDRRPANADRGIAGAWLGLGWIAWRRRQR